MGTRTEPEAAPRCSWCHKSQDEVAKLIATPTDLPAPRSYICDECVAVCNVLLEEPGKVAGIMDRRRARLASRTSAANSASPANSANSANLQEGALQ